MERRFKLRKRQLLEDAKLKSELSKGMLDRLEAFVEPFAASLGRREMRENAQQYVGGGFYQIWNERMLSRLPVAMIEIVALFSDSLGLPLGILGHWKSSWFARWASAWAKTMV